jgi:hypothetical protein
MWKPEHRRAADRTGFVTRVKQPKPETSPPKATAVEATLSGIAQIAGRASGLLRIQDLDERISVENAATVALAKRLRALLSYCFSIQSSAGASPLKETDSETSCCAASL